MDRSGKALLPPLPGTLPHAPHHGGSRFAQSLRPSHLPRAFAQHAVRVLKRADRGSKPIFQGVQSIIGFIAKNR